MHFHAIFMTSDPPVDPKTIPNLRRGPLKKRFLIFRHDADHVRDVQRACGSCGSLEKAQASALVDVPTAPSKRRKTVLLWSRTGSSTRRAQEMLPGKPSRQALCERALHAEVPAVRVEKVTAQRSAQNRPPEVGGETCGEAGRPLDAEQTWGHRFLEA